MLSLKQDNERLQRIVTNKSLTSSQSSLPIPDNNGDQFSLSENASPTATGNFIRHLRSNKNFKDLF